MEQSNETATTYYNDHRRRSFFLSRLFVVVSMFVLIVALGINISVLYSDQRNTGTTRADSGNNQTNLPALPEGCSYQTGENGTVVVCPTAIPEASPTVSANPQFPINVQLPKLPAQCEFMDSEKGIWVSCTSAQPPIPTVAVRSYTSCLPSSQKDTLECSDAQNQKVAVPLPSLPGGCEYKLIGKNYFVDCNNSL
jgi:hypothetical protein